MTLAVDDAFIQAFIDGDFELPISTENDKYEPVQGAPFVRLSVLPSPRVAVGISSTDIMTGLFRIVLYYPRYKGAIPAKTKAEEILDAFKINTTVTAAGQSSRVYQVQRENGVPEDGWYKIVVTVFYETIISRT